MDRRQFLKGAAFLGGALSLTPLVGSAGLPRTALLPKLTTATPSAGWDLRGVVLRTVAEQIAGGDLEPIDPDGCTLPAEAVVVLDNFRNVESPLGYAILTRWEGRIWAHVKLAGTFRHPLIIDQWGRARPYLAIGVSMPPGTYVRGQIIEVSHPDRIALCDRNMDAGLWPYEVLDA